MSITYYKRFRMEVDLDSPPAPRPILPEGLRWVAWREEFLEVHADVKYRAFQNELDSLVFPCLGDPFGCRRLMREIRRKHGFLPSACWLISTDKEHIAAIQGVTDYGPIGSIQNVGVVPAYRGLGLGRALVRQCMSGFATAGLRRVYLEVTAENAAAVQLYRSVGFRKAKTLYKAVDG